MVRPRKILLPVDYSGPCLAITRRAIGLAERFGAEITALRVLVPFASVDRSTLHLTDKFLADRRKKAEFRLRSFIDCQPRHVRITAVLREGNPATEILKQATRDHSDLLMMPSYGFSAFRVLLLGSVTARCLHEAICPVWTGPQESTVIGDESPGPAHIVSAVALGAEGSKGLEWAGALAKAFHSCLTVLHLAPRVDWPTLECCTPWKCRVLAEGFGAIAKSSQNEIEARQILVETNDPSKALPTIAKRLGANLLVLDRSPRYEVPLGSDAYEIIRASACSVLRV